MQTGNAIFDGAENDKRIKDIASCSVVFADAVILARFATDIRIILFYLYTNRIVISHNVNKKPIVLVKFFFNITMVDVVTLNPSK